MALVRYVVCLGLIALLVGCASSYRRIEDPYRTFDREGYSIKPPGPGFYSEENLPEKVIYFGRCVSPTHTLVAYVEEVKLERYSDPQSFLAAATRYLDRQCSVARQRCVTKETRLNSKFGAHTTQYRYTILDFEAKNAPRNTPLEIRARGYIIGHSSIAGLVLHIHYSERALPNELDEGRIEQAFEQFVGGVSLRHAPSR